MTVEAAPAAPDTETAETPEPAPAPQTDDSKRAAKDAAEIEKWKSLARQHESRAKANAEAAQRLEEIEQSQKSEVEKANDKIAKLQEANGSLQAELIRLRVATRHGLTEDQAARLIGTTEEELDADAQEFLKLLGGGKEGEPEEPEEEVTPSGRPKPRLRSGSGGAPALNDDKLLADLKRKVGAA